MKVGAIVASKDPPQGIPLKRILKTVAKDYIKFLPYLGEEFAAEIIPRLCEELRLMLHLPHEVLPAIKCSLEAFIDYKQPLTKTTLKGIILKFQQNKEYLERGEVIPRWGGQDPVWTIMKVEDASTIKLKEVPFVRLEAHTLTGIVAGETHYIVLPIKYVRWLIKEMGYPKYEKAHEKEIVGMLSMIKLEVTKYGRTTIAKVKTSSNHATHNRELAKARINKQCLFRKIPCCRCDYGRDKCVLACRKVTKEVQYGESESSSS